MLCCLTELLCDHWLITTVFTLLFSVVYFYVLRKWSYFSDRNVKFVRGWPIIGSTYRAILGRESGSRAYQRCYEAFPNERFIGIYEVFGSPAYLIRDPDMVKQMAISDFDHFVNHNATFEKGIDPLIDRFLFFAHDEQWRQLRATMSPNFTGSRMRAMHELIVRYTEDFVTTLKDIHNDDASHEYDAKKLIAKYSNDIIATTTFGVEVNTLKDPENDFYKVGQDLTNFGFLKSLKLIAALKLPSLMRALNVRLMSDKSANFLRHIVNVNIEQRKKNNIVRNDFIDLMLKAKDENEATKDQTDDDMGFAVVDEATIKTRPGTKQTMELTNEDIVAGCTGFFLAGFDTVSTNVSFMFHELAVNPDIQARLYDEIVEVQTKLNGQQLNYGALQKLKYLDMVMSESMRRWSTMPISDRVCTKAYTIENFDGTKVQLNPGDSIIFPAFALQMDEKHYKEPEKFDPERFSDANKSSVHPGTYMPFGIGPRACIASRFALMIVKTLTFYILTEFIVEKSEKTQHPLQLKANPIVNDAEKGYFIGLRRRKL